MHNNNKKKTQKNIKAEADNISGATTQNAVFVFPL